MGIRRNRTRCMEKKGAMRRFKNCVDDVFTFAYIHCADIREQAMPHGQEGHRALRDVTINLRARLEQRPGRPTPGRIGPVLLQDGVGEGAADVDGQAAG